MSTGRFEEAMGSLRTALRLNPRMEASLERLEHCLHRTGREDEARMARRSLLGIRGETERLAELDADLAHRPWGEARMRDERRALQAALARAAHEAPFADKAGRTSGDEVIIAYAELGEWAKAMDWVERCYFARPGRLRRVLTDLPFDRRGLGIDPRYAPLLRTAGLESLL